MKNRTLGKFLEKIKRFAAGVSDRDRNALEPNSERDWKILLALFAVAFIATGVFHGVFFVRADRGELFTLSEPSQVGAELDRDGIERAVEMYEAKKMKLQELLTSRDAGKISSSAGTSTVVVGTSTAKEGEKKAESVPPSGFGKPVDPSL